MIDIRVTFAQLLTKSLAQQKTQYITKLPLVMLTQLEIEYITFIKQCLGKHFIPSLDTFRDKFQFLPQESEIPLDVLFDNFSRTRREEYTKQQLLEFMQKNVSNGKPEHTGIVEFLHNLEQKTVIPNPQVIDLKRTPVTELIDTIYRTQWFIPELDKLTNYLVGGDLIVVMAPTKVGKTTFLKESLLVTLLNGDENVLFASQEQSPKKMALQLHAAALNLSHGQLRVGVTDKVRKQLSSHQKSLEERLNEVVITPRISSVQDLHELIQGEGKQFHKVYIDGLNIMKASNGRQEFINIEENVANLKDYANENDMVITGVTQTNRQGAQAGVDVGAHHLAQCFAIGMYADVLLVLIPFEDQGRHFIWCKALLNRNGGTSDGILIENIYQNNQHHYVFCQMPPGWSPQDSGIVIADNIRSARIREAATMLNVSVAELNSRFGEANVNAMASVPVDSSNIF